MSRRMLLSGALMVSSVDPVGAELRGPRRDGGRRLHVPTRGT